MTNGQMFHQSSIYAVVLTTQILLVFSVAQIFTKKLDSVMCTLQMWALKCFVWKDDNVLAYKRKIENPAHFPNRRWWVPSVDVRWYKNESVNMYFFRQFSKM